MAKDNPVDCECALIDMEHDRDGYKAAWEDALALLRRCLACRGTALPADINLDIVKMVGEEVESADPGGVERCASANCPGISNCLVCHPDPLEPAYHDSPLVSWLCTEIAALADVKGGLAFGEWWRKFGWHLVPRNGMSREAIHCAVHMMAEVWKARDAPSSWVQRRWAHELGVDDDDGVPSITHLEELTRRIRLKHEVYTAVEALDKRLTEQLMFLAERYGILTNYVEALVQRVDALNPLRGGREGS